MKFTDTFKKSFEQRYADTREMPLMQYLAECKDNKMMYANAAERMLAAIGEAQVIDTSNDPRLGRIFSNRKMRFYPAFKNFFGNEEAIERIVAYFKHNAQGLEESKQILYLKGPVGGGKSSLVETLKNLMEKNPIYVLKDPNEQNPELQLSPLYESPLTLFTAAEHGEELQAEFGIHPRYLNTVPSGWAQQKLKEFNGDISKFTVVEIYPSKDAQIGIMKVEPGDENNQDVSVLIGKTDIRKLEQFQQSHPYSYSYSGGLNRTTQGLMDFAEMFKANIKTLNPLLMATQEHNYNGTENVPAMPYQGIIVAHSNEAEWFKFRNDKSNEAFLDRVYIVDVPYCLRTEEEAKIYQKMLNGSSLANAALAPKTLEVLSEFIVLTRLMEPGNSTVYTKMKVYNGENVKETMPQAKPVDEYREAAGKEEGMSGLSTRFAFKILSETFNLRPDEVQANPIDLMYVLEEALKREHLQQEKLDKYLSFLKDWSKPQYFNHLDKELRTAYLESYSEFGQTMFENYFLFAESWLEETNTRDPDTGELLDREALNKKLEAIEKAAGIMNVKDFRQDVVRYINKYRLANGGSYPKWTAYEKMKTVIEKKMFAATQDIMPIITMGKKGSAEEQKKHDQFVNRMKDMGYTDGQIKTVVAWWANNKKNG
jgi:serine protein kinase